MIKPYSFKIEFDVKSFQIGSFCADNDSFIADIGFFIFYIGSISAETGLFIAYIGYFSSYTGLFCACIGSFYADIVIFFNEMLYLSCQL